MEDLYYRVKVVDIPLPPLRERKGDIPLLVHHFLRRFNERHGKAVEGISPEAMRVLMACDWPGNVRQLMNALESSVILARGDILERAHLPTDLCERRLETSGATGRPEEDRKGIRDGGEGTAPDEGMVRTGLSFQEAKRQAVRSFEMDFLSEALKENRGNVTKTASQLGMKRQSLQQKLRELGMDAAAFR